MFSYVNISINLFSSSVIQTFQGHKLTQVPYNYAFPGEFHASNCNQFKADPTSRGRVLVHNSQLSS